MHEPGVSKAHRMLRQPENCGRFEIEESKKLLTVRRCQM
jgi:hypothetical protein